MGTDFVGRTAEVSELADLFAAARLVTVVGPGGVGKTRVSLRAASAAMDSYADGVWIVELSGLRDAALLPNTVASRLGLPENDSRSAAEAVLDHLRGLQLMLILDTCEHLVDACASLAEAILREAPRVTLLATSRQPLDVAGEHTYPVAPMPVSEAAELFGLRAATVVPEFEVTVANRADVFRLCQRLDGIPLAIELAAVQLRALPLPELAHRLDSRFAVLAGGRRAVPRHKTLRTAIEWSHDLCSPAEQALWARLSVFAGTFGLDAIEEVCAESEPEREQILAALFGLVDKSVVLRGVTGYRLLDTLREFGAERLAASGQEERWRGRHIARYLRLARHFREHFSGDDQMRLYHELRAAHSNIRMALEYALGGPAGAGQREPAGVELVNALAGYWMISGRLAEADYWIAKILSRHTGASPERAATLVTRGFLRSWQGEVAGSIADCEEGIWIAEKLGEPRLSARGYLHMNLSLTFAGQHEAAEAAGAEARRRLTACGDRTGLLILAPQMGHLYRLSGELDKAVSTCEEGLRLLGADSGEQWIQSYLYLVCGYALFQMPGKEAECAAVARRALIAKNQLGDVAGIAYALDIFGWLAARAGLFGRAACLTGAADSLWRRVGSRFGNTALMEQLHQEMMGPVRDALGPERFDALARSGATCPLEEIIALVAGDADTLPRLGRLRPAGHRHAGPCRHRDGVSEGHRRDDSIHHPPRQDRRGTPARLRTDRPAQPDTRR